MASLLKEEDQLRKTFDEKCAQAEQECTIKSPCNGSNNMEPVANTDSGTSTTAGTQRNESLDSDKSSSVV